MDTFVFTGISGLKKVSALRHLRRYLLTHYMKKPSLNGLEGEEFDEKAKFFIPIVNLSGLTKGDLGAEFGSLDRIYSVKIADFREDLSTVTGEDYRQAECLFIHTHVANVIFGHYRSWLVEQGYQRVLESLNIKYIINLIDNIYTSRIYIRANGYPYTLDQVITWRDVEQMATEILAGKLFPKQSVFEKSKVLSVNHCLNTVAGLLFDAEKKQIYTAYPMSKIRDLERLSRDYTGLNVKEMILEIEVKEREAEEEDKQDYQATLLLLRTVLKEFCEGNIDVILKELHAQIREFRRFFTSSFIAYDPSSPLTKSALDASGLV